MNNTMNIPHKLENLKHNMNIVNILSSMPFFNKREFTNIKIIDNSIIHLQFKIHDNNPLPITIDIVQNIYIHQTKTIYMLPGSALNFESNFLTPQSDNLSIFLANKGYLVIGITPREDNSPTNFDYSLMKNWGLEFHTNDVSKVIESIQEIVHNDYEVLGHSAGSVVALNYASKNTNKNFKALRIIDIVGQYPSDSQEFLNSQVSRDATNTIMSQGTYIDNGFQNLKLISLAARATPTGDSGVPRYPLQGNFTYEGLIYFSGINTNQLPGLLTPITGLPDNWNFKQGFFAGTYNFDPINPLNDNYSFTHTNISTLYSALDSVNSGVFPLEEQRDFYSLWSNSYPLNWNNIRVPTYWINAELGFGDVSNFISLLKNSKVTYNTINNYGHGDPVYSTTAHIDFWNKLFP